MADPEFQSNSLSQKPRIRVNGAFMQPNHGKQVCLLGSVAKSDGGQAFSVKASDGAIINVRMIPPMTETVSGLIEVCGKGQGKNLVQGDTYVTFPEEMELKFDMNAYNELVTLVNTIDEKDNPWRGGN